MKKKIEYKSFSSSILFYLFLSLSVCLSLSLSNHSSIRVEYQKIRCFLYSELGSGFGFQGLYLEFREWLREQGGAEWSETTWWVGKSGPGRSRWCGTRGTEFMEPRWRSRKSLRVDSTRNCKSLSCRRSSSSSGLTTLILFACTISLRFVDFFWLDTVWLVRKLRKVVEKEF